MGKPLEEEVAELTYRIAFLGLAICGAPIFIGKKCSPQVEKYALLKVVLVTVLTISITIAVLLNVSENKMLAFVIPTYLGAGFLFGAYIIPLLRFGFDNGRIVVEDLKSRNSNFQPRPKRFNKENAYIGSSKITGKPVTIPKNARNQHMIVVGSTGTGKTTLMKSLFVDAMINGYPVIIIDPKGNKSTIRDFQNLTAKFGNQGYQFKLFSMADPKSSVSYNPLKRGTPAQIVDRLMASLEWSEQYYKNQAFSWLSDVVEALHGADVEVTVKTLFRILNDRKESERLDDLIAKIENSVLAERLSNTFRSAIKRGQKDLDNLKEQLRRLSNNEFEEILSGGGANESFQLTDLMTQNTVIYFQLTSMNYPQTADTIGKMILLDLKSLGADLHNDVIKKSFDLLPVFIDEFGSYATREFVEPLKTMRDIDFAFHLFMQSLADLDVIDPTFKRQVQQNCLTKVVLRMDDPEEVDYWAGVVGTRDSEERSHQVVKVGPLTLKSGNGTSRATKQHIVEHDVFKRLSRGEAVIIQKNMAEIGTSVSLTKLWNPM